jgi:predicted nucleic acid-binding protein
MTKRFVDTSGWAAWLDSTDHLHQRAAGLFEQTWRGGGRLLTTNWVLVELTALLTRPIRLAKPQQMRFFDELRIDPGISVVSVDASLEAASWQLWMSRSDKNWSATDCASFVVMEQNGLREAITADHHFEQAGFVRLLIP